MWLHVFSNMFKSISNAYVEGSPLYPLVDEAPHQQVSMHF